MTSQDLRALRCVPCPTGAPTLSDEELATLLPQVPEWSVVVRGGIAQLERTFRFPNFVNALAFTDAVGALAEREGHHPSITTEWGKVRVVWWTHVIRGLHLNDFVSAAKTDAIFASRASS